MNKSEAFEHSRTTGDKITHRFFSDKEYITVVGNKVITEEGYSMWKDDFFSYRTSDSWNEDWMIYPEVIPMHVAKLNDSLRKERSYSHYIGRQVKNSFGSITKYSRK